MLKFYRNKQTFVVIAPVESMNNDNNSNYNNYNNNINNNNNNDYNIKLFYHNNIYLYLFII